MECWKCYNKTYMHMYITCKYVLSTHLCTTPLQCSLCFLYLFHGDWDNVGHKNDDTLMHADGGQSSRYQVILFVNNPLQKQVDVLPSKNQALHKLNSFLSLYCHCYKYTMTYVTRISHEQGVRDSTKKCIYVAMHTH